MERQRTCEKHIETSDHKLLFQKYDHGCRLLGEKIAALSGPQILKRVFQLRHVGGNVRCSHLHDTGRPATKHGSCRHHRRMKSFR